MAFQRKLIGEPETYNGYIIEVKYCGPDVLCYVDGNQVGQFYLNAEAARRAGRRHADQLDKEDLNNGNHTN